VLICIAWVPDRKGNVCFPALAFGFAVPAPVPSAGGDRFASFLLATWVLKGRSTQSLFCKPTILRHHRPQSKHPY